MTENAGGSSLVVSDVDRVPVFYSAAFLYAIAVMPGAVAPGFVGAAAAALHLTDSQLGLLFSLYFAGFGLVGASAYVWIRAISWRVVSAVGVALMAGTFMGMASTASFQVLLGLMFLNGIGAGLFGAPAITVLGDMSRPERGFSAMIVFSVVGAAILLALFPIMATHGGFTGVNHLMAGATLACLLLIPWMPRNNDVGQRPVHARADDAGSVTRARLLVSQPLFSLFVMVLFTLGFSGMWTFFERVAFYAHLAPAATSRALAIGTLVGTIGAPVTAYFRRRIPMYYCYGIIVAGIVVTLAILDILVLTDANYLLLVCSFQFWINAGFCIIMALIAEVDKVGRYVAVIPASQALGSFVGPILTGFALEFSGVPVMIAITVGAFVIGAGVFAFVDRRDLASAREAASLLRA